MNITKISQSTPVCFGVACAKHQECARYAAVETATDDVARIATCDEHGGDHPLFVATKSEEAAA